jgi:hypothetical protein
MMKKILFAAVVLGLFAVAGMADVRLPSPTPTAKVKEKKSIETSLYIRLDRDAKEARLIIPKSQVRQLRAQLDGLDDGTNDTAAATSRGFTGTQTIMSGVFLTLAFVFGGVWLARSGKNVSRSGKALGLGAFLFLGGAFATIVFANAGPPPEARSITSKMFTQAVHMYKFGSGTIKLETSDKEDADDVELIVPDPKDGNKSDE